MVSTVELFVLVLFLTIHHSHQESCDERIYPTQVDAINSTRLECEECVLALTNEGGGSVEIIWDCAGSLTFHFGSTPVSISRVTIWYYANPNSGLTGESSVLPSISITSFPTISNRSNHSDQGTYNVSTDSSRAVSVEEVEMVFDPSRHGSGKVYFNLSRVEFYLCRSPNSSVAEEHTGSVFMTTKSPGAESQVLVFSVSAAVLGTLLLLVFITLISLICVVLWKRRPTETYRVNRSLQHNPYELTVNREPPKGAMEDAKLQEHELTTSTNPAPPADPEYATISEWRKISGFPQPQPGISVTNPFYATSSVSIPNKCNTSDPPKCLESSFTRDCYSVQNSPRLKHSSTAHSLQDVRSTTLKESPHSEPPRREAIPPSPTGSLGRRTMTLAGGGSARNISSRAVRRNVSMRDDIVTARKPVPAPRPVLLKKNEGGGDLYLMQSVTQSSPLTQSIRAKKESETASSREVKDSVEDVGNDNYVFLK